MVLSGYLLSKWLRVLFLVMVVVSIFCVVLVFVKFLGEGFNSMFCGYLGGLFN